MFFGVYLSLHIYKKDKRNKKNPNAEVLSAQGWVEHEGETEE